MKLVLRELSVKDEKAFQDMLEAWDNSPGFSMTFGLLEDMSFESYLKMWSAWKLEENCPDGFVPSTGLYAFVGETIVGKVNLRHRLNDFLLNVGGHIGYGVIPSQRGKGYATEMLKLALDFCRGMNLLKVLVTCDEKNLQSRRVIEKNGGVLESTYDPMNGSSKKMRFWISL
jgi:predicted acetyltransferase